MRAEQGRFSTSSSPAMLSTLRVGDKELEKQQKAHTAKP